MQRKKENKIILKTAQAPHLSIQKHIAKLAQKKQIQINKKPNKYDINTPKNRQHNRHKKYIQRQHECQQQEQH